MRIDHFKRWHWAVIGLGLGLVFSVWRGWVGPEGSLLDRPTLEAVDFERLILEKGAAGQPKIRNIKVHSLVEGTYWLSAEQLVPRGVKGPEQYVAVKIPAKTPFVPQAQTRPAKVDPQYTVVDWLESMKSKHPHIGFSTRWWAREPARTPLFAACGMLLLAGLCPRLVSVAYRGQIEAEKKKEQEQKYDLSRFGKGKPDAPKPGRSQVTEADMAHVRELDHELEQRLAAGQAAHAARAAQAAQSAEASPATSASAQSQPHEPRKLEAGPLEGSAADDKPKKQKKFGGEFYPTETHVKQDDQT